jgi:7-carboxy-7-deazaguanine synthase
MSDYDKPVKKIPLVECFGPTIQGEGVVIGQQTYFLRFGLCDYKCTMCDSMHAVNPASVKKYGTFLTPAEIFERLKEVQKPNTTNWVTFSGGNPCIHDLTGLIVLLKQDGWKIAVETQGTFAPGWLKLVDIIVCSPKSPGMGETCNLDTLDKFMCEVVTLYNRPAISLKVVVFDQRDLDFAAEVFKRYTTYALREKTAYKYSKWYPVEFGDCYLSLGNPVPPDNDGNSEIPELAHQQELLKQYRTLYEDIGQHPVLSKVKFLPQWHVFVWGNAKGH